MGEVGSHRHVQRRKGMRSATLYAELGSMGRPCQWVAVCRRKERALLTRKPHSLHAKGFSPVWVRSWTRKLLAWLAR